VKAAKKEEVIPSDMQQSSSGYFIFSSGILKGKRSKDEKMQNRVILFLHVVSYSCKSLFLAVKHWRLSQSRGPGRD
jgi:hypothetical protein